MNVTKTKTKVYKISIAVRFYFRYYLRSVTGLEHWVRVRVSVRVMVMVVPKVKPTQYCLNTKYKRIF